MIKDFFFFSISSLKVTFVVEDGPLTAVEIGDLMFWEGCITMSEPSVCIFYLAAFNTQKFRHNRILKV
jgi:hypothetical protein